MPLSTAELSWRVLGFVNGLRLLASSSLATLFVSIMPETFGQLDPALFAGSATAYFLYAVISVGSIRRRSPDIVLQTWTGVFADVLVLSLLTYASGGVNAGITALVVLSIGATSFILRRQLALSIATAAALAMLIQPGISLLADMDAVGDFSSAAISGALTIVIALGISQLARVLRQNEEIVRERELSSNELSELHRAISQHLREGVLVVDADNNIPLISEPAAMLLQGADLPPGANLDEVSPRLANLLDTWRRYFCDEQRSSPTMMAFDGERRLQLKFMSLDNSTQGPALIFVEDKAKVAAPVWVPKPITPASVEVNRVPVPREIARENAFAAEPPLEPLYESPYESEAPRERSFESPYAASAPRETAFQKPYTGARNERPLQSAFAGASKDRSLQSPYASGAVPRPSSAMAASEARERASVAAAIDSAARQSEPADLSRSGRFRVEAIRENLARQNSFRAALQEVSPWENAPKPAPPAPVVAPPVAAPAPARRQSPQQPQPSRPPGSMLTNNDPRLRMIIGNALQYGRRDSLRIERVDLTAWSKEFLTEFWQTQDVDANTLRLNVPRESVPVRADSGHLHKLLWMLCTDLLKYGRASNATDPVEIRVGRSAKTQRRYLDVIDRGSAVGPIDSKRVFEPFLSAGRAGTGIAMFVSRELSPRIGSGANNDPRPGGGVVFRLVFAEAPSPKPSDDAE